MNPVTRYPSLEECAFWGTSEEISLRQLLRDRLAGVRHVHGNENVVNATQSRIFFALNLHDAEEVTPYILSAILKACLVYNTTDDYNSCFISIYESGSVDGTRDLLRMFDEDLRTLAVARRIVLGGRERTREQHRIAFLAEMRNMALAPFYSDPESWDEIVFINDVFTCASSILELINQKRFHAADVVSGMDYVEHEKQGVLFYDTWVNKDMNGQSFQNAVPFINDEASWERYRKMQPFQVFTTWAGGVVISANLFRRFPVLRFRHSGALECASCECELLLRDLWHLSSPDGLRVLIVPKVFVTYTRKAFKTVANQLQSRVFIQSVSHESDRSHVVSFKQLPPPAFSCSGMEYYGEQMVDFERLVTSSPWEWWYATHWELMKHRTTNVTLHSVLSSALGFYKLKCARTNENPDPLSNSRIPKLFNFVIPTDEPTKMPHMAFMNTLEWIRLNPCFDARIYRSSSETTTASFSNIPSNWSAALNSMVGLRDPFYRVLDSYDRYRIVGFIALYLNGGIFADLETAPTRPVNLTEFVEDFEASFDEKSYGSGPYVAIATPRAPALRRIIDNMLLSVNDRTNQVRKVVQGTESTMNVATLTYDAAADSVMDTLTSLSTGYKQLITTLGYLENSGKLAELVTLRLYDKPLNLAHRSLFKLSDGEILSDGEFLVSSNGQFSDAVVLNSFKQDDNHKEVFDLAAGRNNRMLFLWLRTSKILGSRASDTGCLQIRSDLTHRLEGAVWEACWPKSEELGNTYVSYESGDLMVYTTQPSCFSATENRRVLWASDKIPGELKLNRTLHSFELRLSPAGELLSVTVREKATVSLDYARQRCTVDLFDLHTCNNYVNHSLRQLMRYRQLCEAIH